MTAARVAVDAGWRTDVGAVRSLNEDALLARHPVYVVADGMGGHEAGDRASAAVVAAFAPLCDRDDVSTDDVVAAVARAHAEVARIARRHARGAGSTLTGLVQVRQGGEPTWLVLNIGDSRVYRLFGSRLEQLTIDHSVVQELVAAGSLSPDAAARHPQRHVITRAVGDAQSHADYWLAPIVTGERMLVCSDGLIAELGAEALRAGLSMGGSAAQTAHGLVEQALARGARDNVSVIVIDVRRGALTARADEVTGGFATSAQADPVEADTMTARGRRG